MARMVVMDKTKGGRLMRSYDDIPTGAQDVIDTAKAMFGDCYDNNQYGPFLEGFTPFGNDRMVTLLDVAMGRIDTAIGLPDTNFTIDTYPYNGQAFRYLAIIALVIEMIEHFIRSYVETPDVSSVGAPMANRRDYMNRWQGILADYKQYFNDAIKQITQDMYNDAFASGEYMKVLIDFPSTVSSYIPFNTAERPTIIGWW